jgi:uncharacterized protein
MHPGCGPTPVRTKQTNRQIGVPKMKKLVLVAFVALLAIPAYAATQGQRPAAVQTKLGFEIFKGAMNRGQQFYFRLVAANGQIVLQSESYKAKQGALTGVNSIIRTGVANATIGKSADGQYYFTVKGNNFKITANSETYASRSNVKRALAAVQQIINMVKAHKIQVRGL